MTIGCILYKTIKMNNQIAVKYFIGKVLTFSLLVILFIGLNKTQAQTSNTAPAPTTLSKVFVIGDYQDQYEALFSTYSDILIVASNSNIDSAQLAWSNYMEVMEKYSKEINFDLEGVIMWIHFFWNAEGEVAHVAYHLQPQSKFVKDDRMQAFLRSFVRNYPIEVQHTKGFNHYGSASFPLFYKRR